MTKPQVEQYFFQCNAFCPWEKRLVPSTHMTEILWFWVPLPEPTNWAQVSEEFWESTAQYTTIFQVVLCMLLVTAQRLMSVYDFCSGPGNAFLQTQHFKWSRKSLISHNHIIVRNWKTLLPYVAFHSLGLQKRTITSGKGTSSVGVGSRTWTQFF